MCWSMCCFEGACSLHQCSVLTRCQPRCCSTQVLSSCTVCYVFLDPGLLSVLLLHALVLLQGLVPLITLLCAQYNSIHCCMSLVHITLQRIPWWQNGVVPPWSSKLAIDRQPSSHITTWLLSAGHMAAAITLKMPYSPAAACRPSGTPPSLHAYACLG